MKKKTPPEDKTKLKKLLRRVKTKLTTVELEELEKEQYRQWKKYLDSRISLKHVTFLAQLKADLTTKYGKDAVENDTIQFLPSCGNSYSIGYYKDHIVLVCMDCNSVGYTFKIK